MQTSKNISEKLAMVERHIKKTSAYMMDNNFGDKDICRNYVTGEIIDKDRTFGEELSNLIGQKHALKYVLGHKTL